MERKNYKQEKETNIGIFLICALCLLAITVFQLGPNEMHEKIISKQLELRYPGEEITKLTLQYTDWSSTIQNMDDSFDYKNHRATSAEVFISYDGGERFISLEKGLFYWYTTEKCDSADYEGKTYSITEYSGAEAKYKVVDKTLYRFLRGDWEVYGKWNDITWRLRQYKYKEISDT